MAEGGLPPELDLHLLECPICLERLQQPKSLPCLHSFCQDCLGTYITNELSEKMASATSFPCPVCRRIASPVNQTETKDKWAEQFPTNCVIQDLIQLRERLSEPLYCKPCQTKGNITSPAKFVCKAMNISFCETCKVKHHDILHNKCDILDITVNDNTQYKHDQSVPRCDRHGEKIIWFCEDNKLLCCHECVIEDHRGCREVTKTTECVNKLKAGEQLKEMQAALKNGAEVMDSLVRDFDEQLQAIVQNQQMALQSISDLRQKVDKQLVVYLSCSHIVVSDNRNQKLKLFTDKGQYLDELIIRGCPHDMCLMDNNTVAVAVDSPGGIRVVKVDTSKLSLTSEINMSNGKHCYGIAHVDGKFVVGTGAGELYSVTQDGAAEFLYKYNNTCFALTHEPRKVDTLASVWNNTTRGIAVSRLSADKCRTDVLNVGVVRRAMGIDVDREGNIYVCGGESNNIVQMSADGTHVRELLTSSDGIKCPWTIAVCEDTFVITDTSNIDERNCIRVYQMY